MPQRLFTRSLILLATLPIMCLTLGSIVSLHLVKIFLRLKKFIFIRA